MKNLPKSAQWYLVFVVLLGGAAALLAALTAGSKSRAGIWEFAAYLILAILVSRTKIRLLQRRDAEDNVTMSLAYVLTFAAMLRFGPSGALLVSAVSSLTGCLYPVRQPAYRLCFNVSLAMLETLAASWVFLSLNHGALTLHNPGSYPAVAMASLVFFLINTGGVAIIIGLCTGQNGLKVWHSTFLWTAPSFFAGACVSTLGLMLFSSHSAYILLLLSPLGWVLYQNYATTTARTEEKQQHIEELQLSQEHLADLYLATIKSLALAIDAKDQYTHQHILRVQRYAVAAAKHLGLTGSELEAINTGALLHDIGKLGVPEYVLLKPGRLTDEEFAKIKQHPEIGAAILDPVEFPWPVLPVVRSHHERWDGTGYPDGLAGEDIPRTARILAVADVYDALTSSRSYRNAWTHERACEVIRKDRGSHFDPVIADAFLEVITEVVEEMAREGDGPLIATAPDAVPASPADQAARAIHRASSELWALYELVQTLSSSVGLEETLEILGRKLEALLPGTTALFLLRRTDGEQETDSEEPASEEMTVRSAVGINREFFSGAKTLGGTSLAVARDCASYLGGYDADDLLLISSQTTQWTPLQTALIVPIVHQGKVLGTINLYHPNPNAFSSHDQQLLETIADRAATALFNGLLFDRTRSHAFTDPLTGLYNIRHITQHVEECCREAAPFALLCLDLDSFKPINDNFGHQKGDQVLRDLSALFQSALRPGDVAARYGGDEFLVYVQDGTAENAEALAARLQEAVESYEPGLFHPRLGALHLGVSVGYGCFPDDGTDFASLIAAADAHMYREKTERKLGRLAGDSRSLTLHTHDLHSADPDSIDLHSLGAEFHLPRAA